jgi:hypothetical protein
MDDLNFRVALEKNEADMVASKKTCRCGHGLSHPFVSQKGHYTAFGWLCVTLVGITTRPIRVSYICRKCDTVIHSTTDVHILDSFI